MNAAYEPRYHVPRSQVWGGSRGGQSGNVHLHVCEQFDHGRIHRSPGQALCGRRGWYEREPMAGEQVCSRCEQVAHRLGDDDDPADETLTQDAFWRSVGGGEV